MLDKVARRIERDRMFPGRGTVGVAVSGGADSVAALHALREILAGRDFAVLHLNHGLRAAESDCDEEFVRDLAGRLGCEFLLRRADVAALARRGLNLEQAGRRCRYEFFEDVLGKGSCDAVATGHTRSDQAETVLFRLLRGAGGAGLSGIWPVCRGQVVRPLLDVSREEVLAYLRERDIRWREDASNTDPAFARNRLRHRLLPELRRDWNPGIESALASTADWAVEEERYWRDRVASLCARCAREADGGLLVDVEAAQALHPAEQRRLIASLVRCVASGGRELGFGHVEAVRELILAPRGTGTVDIPGARAERSFGEVLIRPGRAAGPADYDLPLPVPGRATVPGEVPFAVRARVVDAHAAGTPCDTIESALLDRDRVPGPLRLRNWRPGDRYRPAGHGSERKIRDLFQRGRVSAWKRSGWPVVTFPDGRGDGRILWSRGFGAAADVLLRPGSSRALALDELRGADVA